MMILTPKALADFGFTVEEASRAKVQKGKGCPINVKILAIKVEWVFMKF